MVSHVLGSSVMHRKVGHNVPLFFFGEMKSRKTPQFTEKIPILLHRFSGPEINEVSKFLFFLQAFLPCFGNILGHAWYNRRMGVLLYCFGVSGLVWLLFGKEGWGYFLHSEILCFKALETHFSFYVVP